MNWLDIVIIIVLVVAAFIGIKTGLIKAVLSLAGLILGIFLAGRYYLNLAGIMKSLPEQAANILSYIIILLAVMIIAAIIAWFLNKLLNAVLLGWVNHLAGGIAGLLLGAIFVGAILAILVKYTGGASIVSGSFLGTLLVERFPLVLSLLPAEFDSIREFFK